LQERAAYGDRGIEKAVEGSRAGGGRGGIFGHLGLVLVADGHRSRGPAMMILR